MLDDIWKGVTGVIGTVAPTIATALGGPLAGTAVNAITTALGLDSNTPVKDVAAAVQTADPEVLLKLKQAEQEFQATLAKLEVDLEKIAADDRASARQREAQTGDRMPSVLAISLLLLFAGQQIAVFLGMMPTDETSKTALIKGLSLLETALTLMLGYYFGSSASSRRKTDAMSAAIARTR